MKLITWNINSVRARLGRLTALLERHRPDVVCLQETKATDDVFPRKEIEQVGYHVETYGQKSYNGVALLSREPCGAVQRGFPKDPVPDQARVISADISGLRVIDVYVVNGKEVGAPQYELKLDWLERLADWLRNEHHPDQALVMAGDFNIAPEEIDVHDPERWRGKVLFSEPEHQRLRALMDWGLTDLHRVFAGDEGIYSWWDYRFGAFARGWGLRIDLVLGTRSVVEGLQSVEVDREERKKSSGEGSPSDHAPVIAMIGGKA